MSIRFISGFSRLFYFICFCIDFCDVLVGRWILLETGARSTLGSICSTTRLETMDNGLRR